MRSKDPVVSVDTKKKELIGAFKNGGKTWREKSRPDPVFVHDFPSMAKGKAIPYGTYDVSRDDTTKLKFRNQLEQEGGRGLAAIVNLVPATFSVEVEIPMGRDATPSCAKTRPF